jgi:hypothetical protein
MNFYHVVIPVYMELGELTHVLFSHKSCRQIIAIEHVLVYDTAVHKLYQPCLDGLMFGARRWVTSIARQCVRLRDTFHVTRSALRGNWNLEIFTV